MCGQYWRKKGVVRLVQGLAVGLEDATRVAVGKGLLAGGRGGDGTSVRLLIPPSSRC